MKYATPVAAVLLILICGNASFAGDSLRGEMDRLARDVKEVITKRGGGSIAVGGFGEPAGALGSSSASIQLQLRAALEAQNVKVVSDGFDFQITGTYIGKVDEGMQGVRINALLSDSQGSVLQLFHRDLFGEESVPRMLGIAVHDTRKAIDSVPAPRNMEQALLMEIHRASKNPDIFLSGTQIRTVSTSPYAIEILVKRQSTSGEISNTARTSAYSAVRPTANSDPSDKGRPFVLVEKEQVFAVRLINDSDHEAAVNLSLDGINCFQFSEIKSTYWIIPPKSNIVVLGWHKNNETSIEFKSTEFPDSAAAKLKLKPSSKIGLIIAAFSAAWAGPEDQPKDEQARAAGFGEEIQFRTKQVKRQIGHLRDNIVVRYERAPAN